MDLRNFVRRLSALLPTLLLLSCNTLKYVPEGETLLVRNTVVCDESEVSKSKLENYIRQKPNKKTFGLFKNRLGFYSLSNPDSDKWWSRTMRKIGEAPVVYDSIKAEASRSAMERYLFTQGYFHAEVDLKPVTRNRRTVVNYEVHPSAPYRIHSFELPAVEGDSLRMLLKSASDETLIHPGDRFDSEVLDSERKRLETLARRHGYYAFNRDYLSYRVDTTRSDRTVDIEMDIKPVVSYMLLDSLIVLEHSKYWVKSVTFLLDVPVTALRYDGTLDISGYDSTSYRGYGFIFKDRPFISESVLTGSCFIAPGDRYDSPDVERTYNRLNKLKILQYLNIRFVENHSAKADGKWLDCLIFVSSGDANTVSFEIEGTNSAGDLGVAGSAIYTQANMAHRGHELSVSLRGAYEALSSVSSSYFEYGGEVSYTLPTFAFPFLSREKRKSVDAQTSFQLGYNNVSRPEFERATASASMKYSWNKPQFNHTLSPVDISLVSMGYVDPAFEEQYLKPGSYMLYSYQDQLMVRMRYGLLYSTLPFGKRTDNSSYRTFRFNVEESGNLMSLIVPAFADPSADGQYTVAGVPYSQFVRGDFEYVRNLPLSDRLRLTYRAGLGIGFPYGNSQALPFERRFYAGGANSLRGWSVRSLGPGAYSSSDNAINFMTQSGDLKFDLSFELRHKWFGIFEGGYFIDFGNVWTLTGKEGAEHPEGAFHWDSFYEQIACSIGLGVRVNVKFFVFRVDAGMKVYDPSGETPQARWRIAHIDSWDDFALHIAVGYPF